MRISSSDLSIDSSTKSIEEHKARDRFRAFRGDTEVEFEKSGEISRVLDTEDAISISQEALSKAEQKETDTVSESSPLEFRYSPKQKQELYLLSEMFYAWTGKRLSIRNMEDLFAGKKSETDPPADYSHQKKQALADSEHSNGNEAADNENEDWGIEYEHTEYHFEYERLDISAQGKVVTSDGKEIDVRVNLSCSRYFESLETLSLRAGNVRDPLVISLDGTLPELTEDRYEFDLDWDGDTEQVTALGEGAGLLALDRNGDGIVNDGRELFGTRSGDGFSDLATLDADGNSWLDENDPLYENLRVWIRDSDAGSRLLALGELGIGAIFLGTADSEYSYKDSDNDLLGCMRKTGMYLREDGSAGTVHQIDLVAE